MGVTARARVPTMRCTSGDRVEVQPQPEQEARPSPGGGAAVR